MILVEKAQYNSCCFCCKKKKNYNAVISRQNIRIRLLFFVLFCFCETNFDVFTIFSKLSGLKRNVLFMEMYTHLRLLYNKDSSSQPEG